MRASTLFGLTIAILIGMAVVFGVKSAGLFSKPPAAPPPLDAPRVLVFNKNMFEGLTASEMDVTVRAIESGPERQQYELNKHKYLPPYPAIAHLRTLARNVNAYEPLLKEHFQDLVLPGSFESMLRPGMKAVNLQMPRDRAGGGILRKGDHVDVYLTTTISTDPSGQNARIAHAPIALDLTVIVKRDSLFTVLRSDDDSKPIGFTLEANAYRAALIEFAKNKGVITLTATAPSQNYKKGFIPVIQEGKEEERRVNDLLEGGSITDANLAEIFKLPTIQPMQFVPEKTIDLWSSTKFRQTLSFNNGGPGIRQPVPTGYYFAQPAALPASSGCATCDAAKRR